MFAYINYEFLEPYLEFYVFHFGMIGLSLFEGFENANC